MKKILKATIKTTLIYVFFGIAWIVISDSVSQYFFSDSELKKSSFQLIKGIFYVCSTGILLFFLINRFQKKLEEKVKDLEHLNKSLEIEKEKIKVSNEQLENFADTASHDLKSPLRTISTLIQRFQIKFKDHLTEDSKNYLEIIEDSSKKLNDKISETLRFSKVHHYKELQEAVDLNELLKSIENNIRTVIDENNATIKYSKLPEIKSSKNLLYQVFQNLIDNSIKYSKPEISPLIEITSEELGDKWKFCVKDNGLGIAKENYETIFEKYHRVNNKDENEGSGIGLSIVKEIIEKLNGKVWVESTLGQGTCIYFTLPKN